MVTKVTVRRFKRFAEERFELDEAVLLAGPNNSGKTSLLQAISTWRLGLSHWSSKREPGRSTAKARAGVVLTRQQFTAIPLREMNLLWEGRRTAGGDVAAGRKRRIEITLEGSEDGGWRCGLEFEYATPETVYVRPLGALDGAELQHFPPASAQSVSVVHVPPMSGIEREEPYRDRAFQDLLIGSGRPGEVLRNLLLEVARNDESWVLLHQQIDELFGVDISMPVYGPGEPYITCEYRGPDGVSLDLANAGSGFLQVLLLLAFFYARPGSVLLLDEPDAHLHVILQKEVYDLLRTVASDSESQLVIATHSEVLLDESSPSRVISFVGDNPRRLVSVTERDALREGLKRLTTTDLLLASQTGAILYVEDRSDERILSRFAQTLQHPAREFLARPFVHPLRGRSLREAKDHFFAFQHAAQSVSGLVILDRDDREEEDEETVGKGLRVVRWRRYEIENYLLIPRAIAAAADPRQPTLFQAAVEDVFHAEVPIGSDLFGTAAGLTAIKASKTFLPELLEAAGRPLPKRDLFLIAAQLRPDEIHPEVIEKLDLVAEVLTRRAS